MRAASGFLHPELADGLPAGEVYAQPVSQLTSTRPFSLLAGRSPTAWPQLDGVNLMPYLTGKDDGRPHRQMFWSLEALRSGRSARRTGSWRGRTSTPPRSAKLHTLRTIKLQLYDLAADPNEEKNLVDAQPQVVAELQKLFDDFHGSLPPSLATPEIISEWKAVLANASRTPP